MGLVSLMRRTAQSLWMGIFILGLCSDVPTSFPSSLQESAAARGKGSGPVGDQAISDAVEDELRSDSGLAECSIDARTRNGVVTLSGTVDHLLARRRAERVASTVRGVTDVVNEIVVRPPTPVSDNDLRRSVQESMPAGESIAVSVTDGVVTLSGETDSDAARRRAELGAMEVYGIRAIKNAIRISPVERSDPEIVADAKRRLASDAHLRGGGIRAASNHGQVTLTGTVPSAAEKFRAAELSWVAGTSSVDPSELRVAAPSGSPGSQPKIEPLTDADVRSALALALSREGSALRNLKVEVVDGTATLRGDAATLHAKYEAGNEARDVVGVKRVVNRLKVVPSDNPSDDTVRTRVESALRQSPYVRRHNLQATVANGVATLRGRTVSVFEKAQAERVVSRVPGVLAVQNRIEVEGPSKPYLHDPYVDELDSPDVALHDYRPLYTLQDDTEIRESIVSQLFWSPYVDADQVHVEVRNGVATLTGKVSSPEEARAAVKNAYDGGATAVINRMETSAETK